jgi:hypothetical protein
MDAPRIERIEKRADPGQVIPLEEVNDVEPSRGSRRQTRPQAERPAQRLASSMVSPMITSSSVPLGTYVKWIDG